MGVACRYRGSKLVSQINEEQSERREGRSVILHGWVGQLVQRGEGRWLVMCKKGRNKLTRGDAAEQVEIEQEQRK